MQQEVLNAEINQETQQIPQTNETEKQDESVKTNEQQEQLTQAQAEQSGVEEDGVLRQPTPTQEIEIPEEIKAGALYKESEKMYKDGKLTKEVFEQLCRVYKKSFDDAVSGYENEMASVKEQTAKETWEKIASEQQDEYINWAATLSSKDELVNIKKFAENKLRSSGCDESTVKNLLNNKHYLQSIRSERKAIKESAPLMNGGINPYDDLESAAKLNFKRALGFF